jgi:hypothetical protein
MQGCTDEIGRAPTKFWKYGLLLLMVAWSMQAFAIWSCPYLPLIDLPNHMARHYLEAVKLSGGDTGPFYEIEPRLVPNLGAETILPLLILAFGPQVACKVFVTFAVFLYWLGPAWFIAQQGGYRAGALTAALLLLPLSFSGQFYWGFLNFYSGFGLAFLVLVHFAWLNRHERLPIGPTVLHAALVALLFFWHLAPWMIYMVVAYCYFLAGAIRNWRQERTAVIWRGLGVAAALFPSLALFACYSLNNRGINPQAGFDWGGWVRKVIAPFSLFRAYDWKADVVVCLLWLAVVLVCFTRLFRRHSPPIHLLLALAALVGMYLILPYGLGGTMDADGRILPAILVCALAWLGQLAVRRFRTGVLLLTLCVIVRFGSVFASWDRLSTEIGKHAEGFALIEEHSRVMPVILAPFSKDYPGRHSLAWIVLSKNVLVSNLFSDPDQHLLAITRPTPPFIHGKADRTVVDEEAAAYYDFLWVYNPSARTLVLPDSFTCVFSGKDVTVWRAQRQFSTNTATTTARSKWEAYAGE